MVAFFTVLGCSRLCRQDSCRWVRTKVSTSWYCQALVLPFLLHNSQIPLSCHSHVPLLLSNSRGSTTNTVLIISHYSIMLFSKTAVLFALVPVSIAATCNSSNALPYKAADNGGGSNSQSSIDASFQTCTTNCGINGSCLLGASIRLALAIAKTNLAPIAKWPVWPMFVKHVCIVPVCDQSPESSRRLIPWNFKQAHTYPTKVYGSGSDSPNPTALQTCYKMQGRGSRKRAIFSCSNSQTCYSETNGNLFCLNIATGTCSMNVPNVTYEFFIWNQCWQRQPLSIGDYIDINGGQGNVKTGVYTSADALPASTSTRSSSTTATGSLTITSTSATSPAVASATGGSGVEKFHAINAVGVVGAMGVVVRLVLWRGKQI